MKDAMQAYRRLACGVLTTAIAHYFVWHSAVGKSVRIASSKIKRRKNGQARSGEWKRVGIECRPGNGLDRLVAIVTGPDPAKFLTSQTMWHDALGVEAGQFADLLDSPARLREAEALINKAIAPSALSVAPGAKGRSV